MSTSVVFFITAEIFVIRHYKDSRMEANEGKLLRVIIIEVDLSVLTFSATDIK